MSKSTGKRILAGSAGLLVVLLLMAGAGRTVWTYLLRSCEVEAVQKASNLLVRQRDSFDHYYQFATSASPDSIVRPVAELQQILIDTQAVKVPACLQTAKGELVDYMVSVIRAFQAFGAREADRTIRDFIVQSDLHYNHFMTELEEVNACAPLCFP